MQNFFTSQTLFAAQNAQSAFLFQNKQIFFWYRKFSKLFRTNDKCFSEKKQSPRGVLIPPAVLSELTFTRPYPFSQIWTDLNEIYNSLPRIFRSQSDPGFLNRSASWSGGDFFRAPKTPLTQNSFTFAIAWPRERDTTRCWGQGPRPQSTQWAFGPRFPVQVLFLLLHAQQQSDLGVILFRRDWFYS